MNFAKNMHIYSKNYYVTKDKTIDSFDKNVYIIKL